MHYRKSSDDEMEILKAVKNQYIETSLNYFSNWFDFSNSDIYKGMKLKHVFDSIFRSTMVYIDYSTETKYKRNEKLNYLESIMLPYSSMMIPKNFSIISHEVNYYVFQQLKPYLNKKMRVVIDSFYENIDQLITKLGIADQTSDKNEDSLTEVLVDKFLIDFVTLFTAGPNYLMSLFCLLSKNFLNSHLRITHAPDFARIMFLNEIIGGLLINKHEEQDKDCYKDYLEMRKQISIYTECSMENMPFIDGCMHRQFVDVNNFFSKKMIRLINDEFVRCTYTSSKEYHAPSAMYPWKPNDKFYNKKVSFNKIIGRVINLEEPTSVCFPKYPYQYSPDMSEKDKNMVCEEKKATSSKIREYGAISVPEILWEIENRVWISDYCGYSTNKSETNANAITLYHFPQIRVSRMMSCGLRIAILRTFFNLYTKRDSKKLQNSGFMPLDKPNVWLFFDIHWKKMFKSFHSSINNNVLEFDQEGKEKLIVNCLKKLKETFNIDIEKILSEEKNSNYWHKNDCNENTKKHLSGLHYSLCNNGYFIPLNSPITRYKLEKWPIWSGKRTFNKFVKSQFIDSNESVADFVQNFYSYTNVVAERFCSNIKTDIENDCKYLILGKLKNTKLLFHDFALKKNSSLKKIVNVQRKSVFSNLEINMINGKVKKALDNKITNLRNYLSALIKNMEKKLDLTDKSELKEDIKIELSKIKDLFQLDNIGDKSNKTCAKKVELNCKRLLNQTNLLRMKLLNSGLKEYFCLYDIMIEIHNSLKDLDDFLTVVSLIELINMLEDNNQLFEIYLTNSWSDFGLILYHDKTNIENQDNELFNIVRKLQRDVFCFSRTHLLIPNNDKIKNMDQSCKKNCTSSVTKNNENVGSEKLWDINLLIETTKNLSKEFKFSSKDFDEANIRSKASLGSFDYHISFSCNTVRKAYDISNKVIEKFFTEIGSDGISFVKNGDIGVQSIATSLDFSIENNNDKKNK